jgi:8-oxo-dGTP pyrophosphatase MutT (NUDIX family)
VDDSGRILMQCRRDTGQWALPMGKMEIGETPSQCAVRETEEETGVRVEPESSGIPTSIDPSQLGTAL